jgi:two-component system, LytTR family, sensor kinase
MKAWKTVQKYKLHHILVWGGLFCGWYFFRAKDFPGNQIALQVTGIKVAILALLVYFTNYFLIPRLLYKKKYWQFFSVYTILIFGMGLLKLRIIIELVYPGANLFDNFKTRFYDNIIPLFLLVTTGAATKLISDYLQTQRRLNEIAREKAETELKYLKSQINPHFLFNSLNSIYFLIDKQNIEARKTLLQFSDLLRYQLYDCNADTIEIEKELAYLNDYIRLQKLRKDRHYQVTVDTDGNLNGFRIVPLLLMPFVENAFKHISHHNNNENFVHVSFSRKNGSFNFDIENSKEAIRTSTEPVGGIGLNNVKRRLDLLYPGKHELTVTNNETTFKVSLKLSISE